MSSRPAALPAARGSYLLVAELDAPLWIRAGALGRCLFPEGLYLYCGSALGPGGLRARAGRHLSGCGTARWHIDYLLQRTAVRAVWVREGNRRLECQWAEALARSGAAQFPVPRFGASDCRCASHLWRTELRGGELEALLRRLPFAPRCAWPEKESLE